MAKSVKKFKGAVRQFNIVCETILNLVKENLPAFNAHKAYYTAVYIDGLLAKLKASRALTGTSSLVASRASKRIDLKAGGKEVRAFWKALKTYVAAAFPRHEWDAQLEEAGAALFKERATNWGAIDGLGGEAVKYMEKHEAALIANDNMPATFKGAFENALQDYSDLLLVFMTSNGSKVTGVAAQIKANNELYDSIVAISRDSEVVFRALWKRRQFAYKYQLAVMTGGSATLKGYVIDERGLGVANASVVCSLDKYKTVTNAKGYFRLRMCEGEHVVVFEKGLLRAELGVALKAATGKTVKVQLTVENG